MRERAGVGRGHRLASSAADARRQRRSAALRAHARASSRSRVARGVATRRRSRASTRRKAGYVVDGRGDRLRFAPLTERSTLSTGTADGRRRGKREAHRARAQVVPLPRSPTHRRHLEALLVGRKVDDGRLGPLARRGCVCVFVGCRGWTGQLRAPGERARSRRHAPDVRARPLQRDISNPPVFAPAPAVRARLTSCEAIALSAAASAAAACRRCCCCRRWLVCVSDGGLLKEVASIGAERE